MSKRAPSMKGRHTLVICGMVGLPVALLCWAIRESKRGRLDAHSSLPNNGATLMETVRYVMNHIQLDTFPTISGKKTHRAPLGARRTYG